jgi:hypothetical protein
MAISFDDVCALAKLDPLRTVTLHFLSGVELRVVACRAIEVIGCYAMEGDRLILAEDTSR